MKRIIATFSFCFSLLTFSYAQQAPGIVWEKSFGGSSMDAAAFAQQTLDGGYFISGESISNNGDVSGNHGSSDYWVIKLDSNGSLQWQKCFGGTTSDYLLSAQQTSDGGYVLAGSTKSNDGDVSGNNGYVNWWIIKLDGVGNLQWQKCLGGTYIDQPHSVQQTSDGGYIAAGFAGSTDGDVSFNHGFYDGWIVKMDANGNLEWQKCIGGTNYDIALSVQQTFDDGYIICGSTESNDGDVNGNHGDHDFWIAKLDENGNLQWQKCFGGTEWDEAKCIRETSEGGYIVAGSTRSNDGDVSGNHGGGDSWIIKLGGSGNLQWQNCLGGTDWDEAMFIQETSDGSYVVAGYTESNDGDVSGNHGQQDCWIIKLDGIGNLGWQKSLGGNIGDYGKSIVQTTDGGYIVAGTTFSDDGDVSNNNGERDYWIIRLAPDTDNTSQVGSVGDISIHPNPVTNYLTILIDNFDIRQLVIENLLGEICFVQNLTTEYLRLTTEVNVSNFPAGVYLLTAYSNQQRLTKMFVKE